MQEIKPDEMQRDPEWRGKPANKIRNLMDSIQAAKNGHANIEEELEQFRGLEEYEMFPDGPEERIRLLLRKDRTS